MATSTFGTTATSSLTAIIGQPAPGSFPTDVVMGPAIFTNVADFATINNGIKDDINPLHPIWGAGVGLDRDGRLYIPNRGILQVRPGDYIAIDANGWPILVSGYSVATGGWTHVP